MPEHDQKLVLYSQLAFYPIHWQALRHLCLNYCVRGAVITGPPINLPSVQQQLGWVDPHDIAEDGFSVDIHYMPAGGALRRAWWLYQTLRAVRADAIWVQEEPTHPYLLEMLGLNYCRRPPRIVTSVCENIFPRGTGVSRLLCRLLWPRLDALLAVATPSLEGIRAVGMPARVPARTLVAGASTPPEVVEPLPYPFVRATQDFILGFAGRICEEKGWQVLLQALSALPPSFKCLLAGDGPQIQELQGWTNRPGLQGRVFYVGLLPKATLWRFYASLDCLVVPSLTYPRWKEQFGVVLTDGMAMGLPLIGSNSGAIPEVLGPAGLVVPEGQIEALVAAIQRLCADAGLRQRLAAAGRQRFREEFAIPAYADKIAASLGLARRG